MVHLIKLKKKEIPEGWKLFKKFENGAEYRGLSGFVTVHKIGDEYWFDWGIRDGHVLASSFVKDKKKIKPMLKKIMTKEFVLSPA
jgi:hypothetical protein